MTELHLTARRRTPRGALALLLCALALLPATARAQARPEPGPAPSAEALTHTLVGLNARHQRARPADRARLRAEMVEVAALRGATLAALIEDDPGAVRRVALPERVAGAMPPDVQEHLEARLTVEGELEVLHVDAEDPGRSRYLYFLNTPFAGERFALHFAADPPPLLTGTEVRARGVMLFDAPDPDLDGAMALDSGESGLEVLAAGDATATTTEATAPELPNTLGEQRTAVLLVNFIDDPVEPWTVGEVRAAIFGEMSDFLLENSYGQTWLAGDVFGWFTIPFDSASCSNVTVADEADAAAMDAGIDLTAYGRRIYIIPKNPDCSWTGVATVGGSRAWLNGTLAVDVSAHEFGHLLGLYHSHSLNCGAVTVGSECTSAEYGDSLDVMGSRGHLNAFQKQRLGWLGLGSSPTMTDVESDAVVSLEPYEIAPGPKPKAVRILRSTDAATGRRTWYFLEFRRPLGFDAWIASSPYAPMLDGVVLRMGTEAEPNSSFFLDATPGSQSLDKTDGAIVVGAGYDDPDAGVTVLTDRLDEDGAVVSVWFSPSACVHASPELAIEPARSRWLRPGTAFAFAVTLTSHDDPRCPAGAFDLRADAPSGWTATIADAVMTLEPGASATTTLEVTSSGLADDGFYPIAVTAVNDGDPGFTATASATYVVDAGATNEPPLANDDGATTSENTPVTIDVLANDADPDGDPLYVVSASQGTDGTVTVDSGGEVTYTPAVRFKGDDSFQYVVSDGADTAAATVSVSVRKRLRGKGNKP